MTSRDRIVVATLLLLTPVPALAYVDPGSGHLIWQFLLSLVAGSIFYFRAAFGRLRGLFARRPKEKPKP